MRNRTLSIKDLQKEPIKHYNHSVSEKPLVSVCVQTYQHAPYIRECLDSILIQKTDFDFEILLGEDESADGTREICIEYAEKYPDIIRLFLRSRQDVIYINGHPTGRYNMIENLKAAKGKYIALLEGDDYWTNPLKLQKQVEVLEQNPEVIVCHHWQKYGIYNKNGYEEIDAYLINQGYLKQELTTVKEIFKNKLRIKSRTMMFRNVIDDTFFPIWFNKVAFGDVPLNFLLGKYGNFYFMDEPMAVYRQMNSGMSKLGNHKVGEKKNRFDYHMLYWVQIWDYANIFYKYKFNIESSKTIIFFYQKLLSQHKYSLNFLLLVFIHSIIKLKSNLFYRKSILMLAVKQFSLFAWNHIKTSMNRLKNRLLIIK